MRVVWVVMALLCAPAMAGTVAFPVIDDAARLRGDPLPQPQVLSTVAPWLRTTQHAGVVYFLHASPPRVERYALATQQWLPSIALSASPRGFGVSNAGIFVSQTSRVSRFNLDGSGETILANAWTQADDFNVIGPYVVTSRNSMLQSVRIADGVEVALNGSSWSYDTPRRFSVAEGAMVLYGWQYGLSPADILRIPLNADGTFGNTLAGPYHGDYPAGTVVYPDRDGLLLTDEAGIVFNGQTLVYRSGTGGPINATVTADGHRYVLRSGSVARLDTALRETGVIALEQEAHAMAASADQLFLFAGSGVAVMPLARFDAVPVATPPSPALPYLASSVDLADDGTLVLFNRAQRVVHRFSTSQWRYLPSVALHNEPLFASLDRANGRVVVSYEGGRVGVTPSAAAAEQFLAFGPMTALSMGAADGFTLANDYAALRIFDTAGNGSEANVFELGSRFAWSRATRRLYYFGFNGLHFRTLTETGQLTTAGQSPFPVQVQEQWPILPSPSGAFVYLGSGQVFDGINLSLVGTMPEPFIDGAWLGTTLYTVNASATAGQQRLLRWSADNTVAAEGRVFGTDPRIFASGSQIITVASVQGRTVIQRWPASLVGRNVSTVITQISPATPHGGPLSFTVEFTHHGLEASADVQFAVTLSSPVAQLTWLCDAAQGSVPCGSPTGLQLTRPLAVGETLRVSAFGFMPADASSGIGIQAVASNIAGEVEPADNMASGQIPLRDVLFAHGFE